MSLRFVLPTAALKAERPPFSTDWRREGRDAGVHYVVCRPDWNCRERAAPFQRNNELLDLLPKDVVASPGSGITENVVGKAKSLDTPAWVWISA